MLLLVTSREALKMSLTLYYHPLSSYCHKVLIALYEHAVDFDKRIIDLGNAAEKAELQALWPIGKFPVIHDHTGQCDVAESTIIIEYLDHYFAGQNRLIPGNWDTALEVRLWDRVCDNYLQTPLQQIVLDRILGANGNLTQQRATLQTVYSMFDRQLASNSWLASAEFSLADCSAAPALFYASTLERIPDELGHLNAYFERLTNRPSVQRVIEEARPYFSFYPFEQDIPQRFYPRP
jgi:glutathione S-transferase